METQQINKEEIRKDFHMKVFRKIVFKEFLTPTDRKIFADWIKYCNPHMNLFEHYKNKNILFEICKYLGNSELCLQEDIRWLYCSKIDYLLYNIYFYKILEYNGKNAKGDEIKGLTFYKGLAKFSERTQPPHNIKEKSEWQKNIWTGGQEQFLKKVIGYDFGLDIDGETFKDSYKDAKKVFKFFTKMNIRFGVWCSGKKGFHFLIPYEDFSHMLGEFNLDKNITACKGLMLDLVRLLKLKKVDTLIYSATRYLKCPFSIDARNGRVILPLSDPEFLDFEKNYDRYMSPEYCAKLDNLGFLGIFRGRQQNKENFKKMIDYIDEVKT